MENTPKTAEEQLAELQAELAKSIAERDAAVKAAAEATAAAEKALAAAEQTSPTKIKGSYKGYRFDDNHRNVRNRAGELCDTTLLLEAANGKDADKKAAAVEVLDWLIEIKYAHFTKA